MRVYFLKTVGLLFNRLVTFEANQGVTLNKAMLLNKAFNIPVFTEILVVFYSCVNVTSSPKLKLTYLEPVCIRSRAKNPINFASFISSSHSINPIKVQNLTLNKGRKGLSVHIYYTGVRSFEFSNCI